MKGLFITCNGVADENFGGAKASARNYNALMDFAAVDVFHIKKISTLKSLQSVLQGIFPPLLKADIRKIESMLSTEEYDFVFLDSSLFGCIAKMLKKRNVPVALYFHNCESDYNRVRFGNRNTIQSMVYQKLVDREEKIAAENADYKMVFTDRDKRRIESLYHVKVDAVVPIGLIDRYTEGGKKGEYCLLFGPLGTANEKSFSWFVHNVSPHLNCKTVVAGKGFEKYKNIWDSDKVYVKGFVDDISEVYDGAACVAIPLVSGGGMKIKTAEALMFGKYIFGTEEAFVGYDFETDLVGGLCDSVEGFINAINGFLDRDEETFNAYARKLYLEKYSLDAGIKEFKKLECFLKCRNHLYL